MALVGLVGFGFYLSPKTSYGISLAKSSYTYYEPVLLTSEGGPYVIYNVDSGESFGGFSDHSIGDDVNPGLGIGGNFSVIELTEDAVCENNNYTYQECKDSEYFVDEALFSLGADPGSSTSSGGGGAVSNNSPQVTIFKPDRGVKNIKNGVVIEYEATDADERSSNSSRFGLEENPVSIYYLSGKRLQDKILIADDLPAKGSYTWDISKIPEGDIYIVVEAADKGGVTQQALSNELVIDNSAPIFKVTATPEASRGEPVELVVEPSEELFGLPDLFVTQTGYQKVKVKLLQGSEGTFVGTYQPVSGHDGLALVSVSGEDLNKNLGTTTSSGGFFSVGVEPPPKPVVLTPLDQELVATNTIDVLGGNARNDLKLSLVVNNKDTYNIAPNADGTFKFINVALDKLFNNGKNFLRLLAKDPAGNQTEVALTVKFNINPNIGFVSPIAGQVLAGTSSLQVAGSDENGDALKYSFELASKGSVVFTSLAKNLASGIYSFDSGLFADGDYLARVVVDDGSSKTIATSSVFAIRNYLPIITFAKGNKQIVNTKQINLAGKVQSTEVPTGDIANSKMVRYPIDGVEYSLNGGLVWRNVDTNSSGDFNINFEVAEEKSYPVLVRAIDERRLYGRAQVLVIADFGPPKDAVIESPANNAVFTNADDQNKKLAGTQVTLVGKAEPESTVMAVANGIEVSAIVDAKGSFTLPDVSLTKHGANPVLITVVDLAGNKSPGQTLTLQSNNAPTVRFISPRSGRGLGGNTKIVWETRDQDLDKVKTTALKIRKVGASDLTTIVNNPAGEEYVWQLPSSLTTGQYELVVDVSDGVSTAEATVQIVVDKVPPVVNSFKLNQNIFTKSLAVNGQGTASDDLSGIEFAEYSFSEGEWQSADILNGFLNNRASFGFSRKAGLIDGEYQVKARVKDGAGNVSEAVSTKLVVDTTAPRVGGFAIKYANQTLLPNESGDFITTAGGLLNLVVSLEADTKYATATVGSLVLPLSHDQNNLWQTKLSLAEAGTYQIAVEAVDELSHRSEPKVIGRVKAMPSGKVWYFDDNQQAFPVGGAKIEVWVLDEGINELRLWQAESFGAVNPIITDAQGRYSLTLPTGSYELRVSQSGFERLKTDVFTLDRPTLINEDFKMIARSGFIGWLKGLID